LHRLSPSAQSTEWKSSAASTPHIHRMVDATVIREPTADRQNWAVEAVLCRGLP
jgi:hypothetical protein